MFKISPTINASFGDDSPQICDPDNTLKWSPTMYLRRLNNESLQQLWTSMTNSGEPLSEWRDIASVWDLDRIG